MSLLANIIVGVCVGTSGNVRDACTNTLDAGSKASGFDKQVEVIEHRGDKWANKYAETALGDDGKTAAVSILFIAKTLSDRSVDVPLPITALGERMIAKFQPDLVSIGIRWTF
jgi:hypothetical protein